MHVMASQNDILVSSKSQIDQSIYLPEELNSLEQAACWLEVNVLLPTNLRFTHTHVQN